jgi:hypothetical protein
MTKSDLKATMGVLFDAHMKNVIARRQLYIKWFAERNPDVKKELKTAMTREREEAQKMYASLIAFTGKNVDMEAVLFNPFSVAAEAILNEGWHSHQVQVARKAAIHAVIHL